jgi:hypothetical protein
MNPLTLPQVNLNGTSREALVEQQCDVMRALDKLYEAMQEAAPNGRDYQLRPTEFNPAREAWHERMKLIRDMHNEIEAHAVAIQDSK